MNGIQRESSQRQRDKHMCVSVCGRLWSCVGEWVCVCVFPLCLWACVLCVPLNRLVLFNGPQWEVRAGLWRSPCGLSCCRPEADAQGCELIGTAARTRAHTEDVSAPVECMYYVTASGKKTKPNISPEHGREFFTINLFSIDLRIKPFLWRLWPHPSKSGNHCFVSFILTPEWHIRPTAWLKERNSFFKLV